MTTWSAAEEVKVRNAVSHSETVPKALKDILVKTNTPANYTCNVTRSSQETQITTKSGTESKNTAPACVLVQGNKYPEATQDYGSSCAPKTNDTVLQRRLQIHAKDACYHGSNACCKACH